LNEEETCERDRLALRFMVHSYSLPTFLSIPILACLFNLSRFDEPTPPAVSMTESRTRCATRGHYGTILVDLEHRRIATLLPERSVETSTAWFKQHPKVDVVSRDRGKLFREAISAGAPQAKHIVDRFHLQKNFAQALEKFFAHRKRLLKQVARGLSGKALAAPQTAVHKPVERERRHRHR